MTKFSFAVPVAHLKDLEPYQDFTFGLSFLLSNKEYEAYLKRKISEGHLVYLDNSYNETQRAATPEEVADLYLKYRPSAVVSPDSDYWTPLETFAAYNNLRKMVPPDGIMTIFRSEVEYHGLLHIHNGPMAVSYWWMDGLPEDCLEGVHFLGLSELERIVRVNPPTLDTSRIVKMALRGERFEDWNGHYKEGLTRQTPSETQARLERAWSFFNQTLTDEQLDLVVHNMVALKSYVSSRQVPLRDG